MSGALADRRGVEVNIALLTALILHNLTYPLSTAGSAWPVVFYLFYSMLFVAATWALSPCRSLRLLILACGIAVLAAGIANSYWPNSSAALAVFVSSIAYHVVFGLVLVRYAFTGRPVLNDVVLAATSLYLVIGSGFAAVFALIEWLAPGSYVASSGAGISWQQMVYFSYVTLTTVGYGDITPVGFYAQSIASFEAVLGVLYTVVLLARLVGLQAGGPKPD